MRNRALCWSLLLTHLLLAATQAFAQSPRGAEAVAVQGILISANGRSALIEGQLAREGDTVLGAQVAEISEMGVVLTSDGAALTVPVGGSASWADAVPVRTATLRRAPPATAKAADAQSAGQRHTVAAGDTLSEIAADNLAPGMSLDEAMHSIFTENRHAFGDDMHHLKAGATLSLPPTTVDSRPASEILSADTRTPYVDSLPLEPRPVEAAAAAADPEDSYGPVRPGETLSEIVFRLPERDYTADQIMIAIYELNPEAFLNNINMLKAGATLKLPAESDLERLSRDYAAGEVQRQSDLWRHGRAPILAQAL